MTLWIIGGIIAVALVGAAVFIWRLVRVDTEAWYRDEHEGHARHQRPDKWL